MKRLMSMGLVLTLLLAGMLGCTPQAAAPEPAAPAEQQPSAPAEQPTEPAAPAEGEKEGLRVAVAHHTLVDEWSKGVYDELIRQAPEFGITELNIQNADLNVEMQARHVEDFIAQKYDAIIIDPISEEGMTATLKKAGEAGIPVFAYDSFTSYEDLITHVAWDHAETGIVSGKWVADYAKANLGGKVKVGLLQMLNYEHTAIRGVTFKETLEAELGKENVEYVYDLDHGESVDNAASIVSNNIGKPIDVIWGAVDNAAQGARSSLKLNNIQGTIVVCAGAWGSVPFQLLVDDDQYYKMCVGVSSSRIATLSLQSVRDYFDGKEVPKKQNIELDVIEASNVDQFLQFVQ